MVQLTDGLGQTEELEFVGVVATDAEGNMVDLVVKGQGRGEETD